MAKPGRFVVVFDLTLHALLMCEAEDYPERGMLFETKEDAIKALEGHMLATVACVLDLDDSLF